MESAYPSISGALNTDECADGSCGLPDEATDADYD